MTFRLLKILILLALLSSLQDYLWNQPHSTRSLGRDFRLRRGAGHGLVAAANAGYPGGVGAAAAGGYGAAAYGVGNGLAAAGRSRSLGAGINRDHYGLSDWDYGGGGGYGTAAAGYGTRITDPLLLAEEERRGRKS